MTKAQRLLALIQIFRSHRFPVTAAYLAQKLDISTRTLYRDITQLRQQGACIEGEPGIGYLLRPGFLLPPLMLSHDEIEALMLGGHWVSSHGDAALAEAARSALAKIHDVVPDTYRHAMDTPYLRVGPSPDTIDQPYLAELRHALRHRYKLVLDYQDQHKNVSTRTVWPIAMGYFDRLCVLVAWCESRQDFRHFRTDRIRHLQMLEQCYPHHRHLLLKAWEVSEGISPRQRY